MCPSVRPSVGAGALKQLSAEELALAFMTSERTPILSLFFILADRLRAYAQ